MDVLVLIDKLDQLVHEAKAVPLTDQVRIDREEIWEILDQMRATIPEEIKQARWIVKERQEMLGEAKREAERLINEAREQAAQLASQQEIVRLAERQAAELMAEARRREREVRLGAEDYADEILSTLEIEPRASSCPPCSAAASSCSSARPTARRPATRSSVRRITSTFLAESRRTRLALPDTCRDFSASCSVATRWRSSSCCAPTDSSCPSRAA